MASRGHGRLEVEGTGRGTTGASALWWIQIPYASRWRRRLRRGSLPPSSWGNRHHLQHEDRGAGGRGNRDRDDKGKRPMVVPDPICEPVEEALEEGELAPIIIGQPTAPSTQVEAGEGSSAGQKKKKKKKRLATDEGKAWLVEKIEMWERWLNASKPLLGLELGMEGVVPYVAKKCDEKPPYSAWVMMHKELASFAETHCAIVRPIACHNIEAEPILVYPYWNGRDIRQWKNLEHTTRGTRLPDNSGRLMNLITRSFAVDGQEEHRMPTWEDERSLVFAALGDLGMAQQVHVATSVNGRKYPRVPKKQRDWIAPELVDSNIQKLAARNIHIHPVLYEYNKATDVYALGVLTHQVL
ncbi:hypothetical protein R1sor_003404 [Riccia sorocarpa]|uniref:Uncharacterized protein n=1 Tax=Riccia sorocarpa TaxID=122646 RepID=A0ABD3H1I4_9MARC